MLKEISLKNIDSFEKDYKKRPENEIASRAVIKNGIVNSAIDPKVVNSVRNTYSVDVDSGDVTNQRQSGRCWMFAGLNVIRTILMRRLNVKNIELSEAYLQFYDRLEKSNFTLEKAIELSDEPYTSRLNQFIYDNGNGDGGYFEFFASLVQKYGVVPIDEMPDGACSQNTNDLNDVLNRLLHKDIAVLRRRAKKESKAELRKYKDEMLSEIYKVLEISLGTPVRDFVYEYKDKDNKFVRLPRLTPKEFYDQYIGTDLNEYIALDDYPVEGIKEGHKYTSDFVQNVIGGKPVIIYQTGLKAMKEAVINSLKNNDVVWFGSDVVASSLRKEGILAKDVIKEDELFDVKFASDKGENLMYHSNSCCHAMTITGVNLDENGVPNRWKVENSWGKDNGKDGYFMMDDKWFDSYVYEVFLNKKYIAPELVKQYEEGKVQKIEPFVPVFAKLVD